MRTYELMDYNELTDEELLNLARVSDNDSGKSAKYKSALISRYMQTIIIKANKLCAGRSYGADLREDLISEGFIGLLSAIRSFDGKKGGFKVFANICINNKMKTQLSIIRRLPETVDGFDLNLLVDLAPNIDEIMINRESDSEFLNTIKKYLSDFEYNALLLYMNGYTYKNIAEKYCVNIKSVDNALSRARGKLKALKN